MNTQRIKAACNNLENRFFIYDEISVIKQATRAIKNIHPESVTIESLGVIESALEMVVEYSALPHIQDKKEVKKICDSIVNNFIIMMDRDRLINELWLRGDVFELNEYQVSKLC